ncbi:DoxX family protein [Marinomonas spartinae]|uniref:DoxX family protein n=1 Tax=Marinomonas spartinae TaxID=1792290 RepID=UPI0018F220B1|nr:DoxX family protein [Marinomonas spartinae]MBJ7555184.1 DoxX family protein [Marinomonas spartinae]
MSNVIDKRFLLALRLGMAWTFLYACSHQVFDPNFSIVGFLNSTKTFHGFFSYFTGPVIAPIVSFMVAYGHLAIGLSLLFGLFVRISAPFGALVLFMYWMANMDFPYVVDHHNFIIDSHIIYCIVLIMLAVKNAGHYYGLDNVLAQSDLLKKGSLSKLKPIVG